MSVTGIVAALTAEARTLGPTVTDSDSIQSLPDGTLLMISGMGPEAAAAAAHALVAAGVRNLLSFGLAGALDPQLRAGSVVLPESVIDENGAAHSTYSPWRLRLTSLADAMLKDYRDTVRGGRMLSAARPLASATAKSQAWTRTGARAVDMESFAIGSVAAAHSLNFAIARVVVDLAGDTVPDSVTAATNPRGDVSLPRLLGGLLRAPSEVTALITLGKRYGAARRVLRNLGARGVGLS